MKELEQNGFCVIPGVATAQECNQYVAEYKDWLSQFHDDDDWPFNTHSIIHGYRIGHFETTWEARLKTRKVFEDVWQTQKLLTSFDGVAISPPPEDGLTNYTTHAHWLHIDHSPARSGQHIYQGALYLEATSETDYCFRVLNGSHRHTDTFYTSHERAKRKSGAGDFYRLTTDEVDWFKSRDCVLTNVPVPKGGMVLWDSRTVHDNTRPEYGRPNKDRWRFVVFSCMGPARWASPKDLSIKRKAYKELLMTAHWPCQGVRVFESRIPSKQIVPEIMPKIACSDDVRRLCGILQYDFEDGESNGPNWDPVWRN